MTAFFTLEEAARRYARYRPKVHGVLVEKLRATCGDRRWSRGLDVACGTGESTEPLLAVCDEVLGIDASAEMLRRAEGRGFATRCCTLEDLDDAGTFDLLACCMAFHWFEPTAALAAFKRLSAPGATWLVTNFAFAGHATNEAFNRWSRVDYQARYPTPPRNRSAGVVPADDPEVTELAAGREVLPLRFTSDELVGYLTTQSNVEAAVQAGTSYAEVEADLRSSLAGIDLAGEFRYAFSWAVYRCGIA